MARRAALVGCLGLVTACSSAPEQVAAPPRPSATATASAPPPAPPRKLDGTPVVLVGRKDTGVGGAEWAWLMPEGRLATLSAPDDEGQRAVLGGNFFAGPNGVLVGMELSGELTLSADGGLHRLGKFEHVAFDSAGRTILAWNTQDWQLFSRAGASLHASRTSVVAPYLLPSGALLEAERQRLRLRNPAMERRVDMACSVSAVFAAAQRVVCQTPPASPADPKIAVVTFATDTGIRLSNTQLPHGLRLGYAVSRDGGTLAISGERVEIQPLGAGPNWPSSRVIFRRDPSESWRAPRSAFTRDGKTLCVEETAVTRVLDTTSAWKNGSPSAPPRSPKGMRTACVFAAREGLAVGPATAAAPPEWEAIVLQVPVREGYEPAMRRLTANGRIESDAVSFDGKTAALAEQRRIENGERSAWSYQVALVDTATSAVKRVVRLGANVTNKWAVPEIPQLELSDDGAQMRACAPRLFPGGCRVFDTATGDAVKDTAWKRPSPARTELTTWTGELPETEINGVIGALGLPPENKAKVTAWKDEGAYVAVELDLGDGASFRLNVADGADRTARDVIALAGGSLLGVSVQGTMELWTTQPLDPRAVLVPAQGGGVALFADGSLEPFGDAARSLACLREEKLFPIDKCGDVWATKGTLAKLVEATKARPR